MPDEPTRRGQPTRWPTVEEQLRESKVKAGSALEKLILENQDFEMLRPDELHDKLRLPPWLRVYWRKNHPDAVFEPPSAGYPLVLKEFYEWMIHHQDLPLQKSPEPKSSSGGSDGKGQPDGE
jgi:hypothetical protein